MSDMSRLDPRRLNSPARRAIAGLAIEIPMEHRGVMAIRFLLFMTLFIFGFTYASTQPRVYHDVLIWRHNATPPHPVYIYRNITSWTNTKGLSSNNAGGGDDTTLFGSFLWNKTRSPGPAPRICNDTRFTNTRYGIVCDGAGWSQSSRIGFEDSLGFRKEGEKVGMFYIDRYVFWMVVVFGGVAVGHCLVCLCHSLQPGGIAFYRYEVIMDCILALAFLSLGILPLAWLPSGRLAGKEGSLEKWGYNVTDQLLSNRLDLKTGTVMGWLCFIAFGALIVLNMILIDDLNMFVKIIQRTQTSTQRTQRNTSAHDDVSETVPELGPVGNTGSYYSERSSGSPRRRTSGGNGV